MLFIAEALLNIHQKAAVVCQNLSATLQAYDEALAAANSGGQFGSVATSLDGVSCPSGVCPCAGLRRMLLGDGTCRLEVRTIQTEPKVAVPDGYDVAIKEIRQCPSDNLNACIAGTDIAMASGGTAPFTLDAGVIAGIVVSASVLVLFVAGVTNCFLSSRRLEHDEAAKFVKGDFVNFVHGT